VPRERKRPGRAVLEAALRHQDALEAAGLPAAVLEQYESAVRGLASQERPLSGAAQVLVRDVQREVEEFQAAFRKEFAGDASPRPAFRAQEPMPADPREVLALGLQVVREAPDYAPKLIKYALNAASTRHLEALCHQLAGELGPADLPQQARALEEQIRAAARKAFAGRAELEAFEPG
jgi:hypothetical protein